MTNIESLTEYKILSRKVTDIIIGFDGKFIIRNNIKKIELKHYYDYKIIKIPNSVIKFKYGKDGYHGVNIKNFKNIPNSVKYLHSYGLKIKIPNKIIYFSGECLKINVNYCLYLFPHSSRKIKNVSGLGNVHTLTLSDTSVTDVSGLGNVHKLDLCPSEVTNVSDLGKVHTLYLRFSFNVTDVSMLGKVHTLSLRDLDITDVSNLGNVHTLDLGDTKVKDVSMLKNVHILELSRNMRNIKGVNELKNIEWDM